MSQSQRQTLLVYRSLGGNVACGVHVCSSTRRRPKCSETAAGGCRRKRRPNVCIFVLPGLAGQRPRHRRDFPRARDGEEQGSADAEHLYLFQQGQTGERPSWKKVGQALQYEKDFAVRPSTCSRAPTLEEDGVRFRYEFTNRSATAYEMIYAVTDPRLGSIFHDVRLEANVMYSHKEGFELLASDDSEPADDANREWLPSRYLASFTWPVFRSKRVDLREGITYYNKSRAVDQGRWLRHSPPTASGLWPALPARRAMCGATPS